MYNILVISHNNKEALIDKVHNLVIKRQRPLCITIIDLYSDDGTESWIFEEFNNICLEASQIHPEVYQLSGTTKDAIEMGRGILGNVNEIHMVIS